MKLNTFFIGIFMRIGNCEGYIWVITVFGYSLKFLSCMNLSQMMGILDDHNYLHFCTFIGPYIDPMSEDEMADM